VPPIVAVALGLLGLAVAARLLDAGARDLGLPAPVVSMLQALVLA
jgi:hypothetical protein